MKVFRYLSRISTGLLLPVLAGLSLFVSAQNIKQPVTLRTDHLSLGKTLDTLARTAHVTFSYNPEAIGADRIVDVDVNRKPLSGLLDGLLIPLHIKWMPVQGVLVLKPIAPDETNSIEKSNFTVSGFVRDSLTGEVLIGATVYVEGTSLGTTSNAYGFYSLTLPSRYSELVFSYVGYLPQMLKVTGNGGVRYNALLKTRRVEIAAVEISDQSRTTLIREGLPGQMKLTPVMLSQLPAFAGQKDIVKSLSSLPGITGFGDGSALFYVRGGASDQNLLMIDDAPIYNPAHLFGFFSAMAPDAISDVEAFKGGFPAQYGGRISSVIHVRTKDGNLFRTGFAGDISPYTSNFTVEGPILENRSSYYLTARISNLNWIKPENGALTNFDFHFFDVNAKLNFRISENNRVFVTLFGGADNFNRDGSSSLKTYGIYWNNQLGAIRWNHIFGQRLFSNTTIYTSRYDYKMFVSKELDDYWNSSINNSMVKTDFTWFSGAKNTLKTGAEFGIYFINPGNVQFSDEEIRKNTPIIPKYRSRSFAVYVNDEWRFREKWTLNMGFRLSSWRDVGPTTLYTYDALHQLIDTRDVTGGEVYDWFVEPEPRFSLGWKPVPGIELNLSYSRTVQFLQVLSNSISPFTSLEVWAPAGPNIGPQKSDQVALGFSSLSQSGKYALSGGLYYRRLDGQIDYADNANLLYNKYLESDIRTGTGRAYGLELMFRKTAGRLTGWVGYTWSRSFRTTPEVNNGEEYPASCDRPHSLTLCATYSLSPRISVSGAWYYMTGGAWSSPVSYMSFNGYVVPVYGARNNSRLPDYHRLDVSATIRLNKTGARYQHNIVLSVYNAYGRYNPFSLNNNKIAAGNGGFVVPADLSGDVEIIPTTLSASGVIPSLNYQFRF